MGSAAGSGRVTAVPQVWLRQTTRKPPYRCVGSLGLPTLTRVTRSPALRVRAHPEARGDLWTTAASPSRAWGGRCSLRGRRRAPGRGVSEGYQSQLSNPCDVHEHRSPDGAGGPALPPRAAGRALSGAATPLPGLGAADAPQPPQEAPA